MLAIVLVFEKFAVLKVNINDIDSRADQLADVLGSDYL